ncbi:MAG: hypothetical protein IPK67_04175 [Planctomycetes bacterium]|nr:hypothetical protein [Planctomycetota bacterium]
MLLHVVDARDNLELDDLSLYRLSEWDALGIDERLERPTGDPIGVSLRSPLEIAYATDDLASGLPMHFVQRTGYAMGCILVDPLAAGEFFLRLEPIGSLRLAIDGANRDPKLRLQLYQELGPVLKSITQWRGDQLGSEARPILAVEELVGGPYRVRAEVGSTLEPQSLAEQSFTIVPGQQSQVVLAITDLPQEGKVEVVITVKFSAGWDVKAFELTVYSLDVVIRSTYRTQKIPSSSMSTIEAGTWISDPILLDAGRCRIAIQQAHFAKEFFLAGLLRQELLVEVPPAGRVVAHLTDAATGKPVSGASYRWGHKGPLDKRAYLVGSGQSETSPGTFEFMAPCGTVWIDACVGAHLSALGALEVVPGTNELSLSLEPDYSVELVLREGDKLVPWTMRAMDDVKFERVDDLPFRGRASMSSGSGRLTCFQTQPGTYRVTLPALAGYRKIEPFEWILDRNSPSEKVIQLVRE